jgi:hypothetical protein
MPIYNTRDLLPFVNQLEQKINDMNDGLSSWNTNKFKVLSSLTTVDTTKVTAMTALVRADEAMAELGTATFKSTANRGKRLEDTLNKLRDEMYEIAASVEGGGGGGDLTSGMFYDELNNAIASVDPTIEDGMKLDYRLRELQDMAAGGGALTQKRLHMPYKHEVPVPETASYVIPQQEGVIFVEGDVTVLDETGTPFLDIDGRMITGTISEYGQVNLTAVPPRAYTAYFPVRMQLQDIPEDFLYLFMEQVISKNSRVMEIVLTFEDKIENILTDIEYMKGVNWTPDFSIMRNHQELVKEGITPKGLDIEVKDGMAHVTFSYNDHPYLSHFVLEKWDEELQKFVPYDGDQGIVQR